MSTKLTRLYGALVCLPLIAAAALASTNSAAADIYDSAVHHPGRSSDDLKRDESEHPAEVLRLSGIKPGMQVADVLAGGGYYSELLSYVVGPKGHVLLLNNAAYDHFSDGEWQKRLAGDRARPSGQRGNPQRGASEEIPSGGDRAASEEIPSGGNRLANVEHHTADLEHLDLPDHSLDALILIKVYHDLYWVDTDPKTIWPRMNTSAVLDQLARVLKPGGILLIEDHSAKPGTGAGDASRLHRIDEAYTVKDFEKRGLKLVGKSDILRRPDDKRELVSYTPPGLGHTDRFLLVFRKS